MGCPREEWAKAELIQPSVQYTAGHGRAQRHASPWGRRADPGGFLLGQIVPPPSRVILRGALVVGRVDSALSLGV